MQSMDGDTGASAERPALRLHRPESPPAALGLAVNYLMTKPAFARLRFGAWSRVLTGQIKRKHYYFVLDIRNEVVGFLGWAVTHKAVAEAWVTGQSDFSDAQASEGDCIVFNAWAARNTTVNRFLLDAARTVMADKDTVYFKRSYADGGVRPVRLAVNEFVVAHLRNAADLGPPEATAGRTPERTGTNQVQSAGTLPG